MPSLLHEGVLDLIRNQPTFAADLLGQLLGVELPRFTTARIADVTLNQLVPVEFRADAVVMFEADAPVLGAIIEAQRQRDDDKLFSWPVYATCARAQHRCRFVIIVVASDGETAAWADQRIDLGGGNTYHPFVIGPDDVPIVVDPDQASRQLHLAMLSVIAHGRGDIATASAIGAAASHAIRQLPEEQREVYSMLIEAALSEQARKAVQMRTPLENLVIKLQAQNREEARTEGKAEGKAEEAGNVVLKLLTKRGIAVTDAQRQRLLDCRDLAVLESWIDRLLTVTSADELFA